MYPKSMDLIDNRNSMLNRLAEKLDKNVGYRGDLATADYIPLDKSNAKLLITYDPYVGKVNADEVRNYILGSYETKIVPCMETLRYHSTENCVAICVKILRETRPYSDRKNMLSIASTLFLDTTMKDTWEVNAHDDGSKYLSRVTDESISDIVAERKRRMHVKASAVTFASLQKKQQEREEEIKNVPDSLIEAEMENAKLRRALAETQLSSNVDNIEAGDTVKFYDKGSLFEGVVLKEDAAGVTVKCNGANFLISKEAIIGLVEKSEVSEKDTQKKLKDYFGEAYDFNNQDLNTLTRK